MRSRLRGFEFAAAEAAERIEVIEQGALAPVVRAAEVGRIGQAVARMRKVVGSEAIEEQSRQLLAVAIADIEGELERVEGASSFDPQDVLDERTRDSYREVFALIYEC